MRSIIIDSFTTNSACWASFRPSEAVPQRNLRDRTRGFFRQFLRDHWPVAQYGQRWQVETGFSMLKRLLGSAVRSCKRHAIDREIFLRVLTINLMIVLHLLRCFQQSKKNPINISNKKYRYHK